MSTVDGLAPGAGYTRAAADALTRQGPGWPGNRRGRPLPNVTCQEILESLSITGHDLVLEVGSGDHPISRSDILSDKTLGATADREGRAIHIDRRPFIACDAQKLPFKDKSFNYVIARQMLEYVDDPAKFLRELVRVGQRGYIEVANGLRELLFDWDARKWAVKVDDHGKLLVRRKTFKGPLGNLFHRLPDPYLEQFINRNWSLFNYSLEWQGGIDYVIDETKVDTMALSSELEIDFSECRVADLLGGRARGLARAVLAFCPAALRKPVYKFAERSGARGGKRETVPWSRVQDLMACPVCHGDVRLGETGDAVGCLSCGRAYPCVSRNGIIIPIMLEESIVKRPK